MLTFFLTMHSLVFQDHPGDDFFVGLKANNAFDPCDNATCTGKFRYIDVDDEPFVYNSYMTGGITRENVEFHKCSYAEGRYLVSLPLL